MNIRAWSKIGALTVIALVAGCAGASVDRGNTPYVYGLSGVDDATSNLYDPYIVGRDRSVCPGVSQGIRCFLLSRGSGRYSNEDLVMIVIAGQSSNHLQIDANDFEAALAAPRGCIASRTEETKTPAGHSYGYAACGQKDRLYSATMTTNRWGHAYFILMQSLGAAPTERDLQDILGDIRFPA